MDSEEWYYPDDFIKSAEQLCKTMLFITRLNDVYDVKVELIKTRSLASKVKKNEKV